MEFEVLYWIAYDREKSKAGRNSGPNTMCINKKGCLCFVFVLFVSLRWKVLASKTNGSNFSLFNPGPHTLLDQSDSL